MRRDNILPQLAQYEAYGVTTVTSLGLNLDVFYQLQPALHDSCGQALVSVGDSSALRVKSTRFVTAECRCSVSAAEARASTPGSRAHRLEPIRRPSAHVLMKVCTSVLCTASAQRWPYITQLEASPHSAVPGH